MTNKEVVGIINECNDLNIFHEQVKIVLQDSKHYKLAVNLRKYCELHKKRNQGPEHLLPAQKQEKLLLKQSLVDGLKDIQVS